MSQSLKRIRSLVSEIEEIHRQGKEQKSHDPFLELASVVDISDAIHPKPSDAEKIYLRFSPGVSVCLQLDDSSEVVQLKKVGAELEVRFEDGKAFHLPLRSVA